MTDLVKRLRAAPSVDSDTVLELCWEAADRISGMEAELYEESAAGRAARLTIVDDLNQLQRKYDALVEKITMALDAIDAEPMALREPATSVAIGRAQVSDELRALLENDDD